MTPNEYAIAITIVLLALIVFLLPSIIAFNKKHTYRWFILFINIAFGFTLVCWFGTLILAIAGDGEKRKI